MVDPNIAYRIVELMNEALALDAKALNELYAFKVSAEAFIEHPTIQVDAAGGCRLIGLLNGIAGSNTASLGAIAAIEEPDGTVSKFIVIENRLPGVQVELKIPNDV